LTREQIEARIASFHEIAPGAICDLIQFRLVSIDGDTAVFRCATEDWMRNTMGFLHGGIGATILDQAMSLVAHCVKKGKGTTPAIEMQLSYHRPIIPGEDVDVSVRTLCVTKSLIRLCAEAGQNNKLCISCSGTYFQKDS
jgi:uncharacterized protein (TIGR00369 family)